MHGEVSPMHGEVSPMLGKVSPMHGEVSSMHGKVSPMLGDSFTNAWRSFVNAWRSFVNAWTKFRQCMAKFRRPSKFSYYHTLFPVTLHASKQWKIGNQCAACIKIDMQELRTWSVKFIFIPVMAFSPTWNIRVNYYKWFRKHLSPNSRISSFLT